MIRHLLLFAILAPLLVVVLASEPRRRLVRRGGHCGDHDDRLYRRGGDRHQHHHHHCDDDTTTDYPSATDSQTTDSQTTSPDPSPSQPTSSVAETSDSITSDSTTSSTAPPSSASSSVSSSETTTSSPESSDSSSFTSTSSTTSTSTSVQATTSTSSSSSTQTSFKSTSTKLSTTSAAPSSTPSSSTFDLHGRNDWVYLGCYKDDPNSRTFPTQGGTSQPNTNAVCQDACTYQGFYQPAYAATEWGVECYCSSTPPTTQLSSNCDMPCPGDSGDTCGGSKALSVYYRPSISTQSVHGPPGWFSLHIENPLAGVTPAQAERIIAMTGGIGEHAAVDYWNYMSVCVNNGDGNGYTLSLGGFTTAWGDVHDMFQKMLDAYPDYWLAKKWLPRLKKGGNGMNNVAGLDGFCADVQSVGNNDPIFNYGVWAEVNSSAWYPAHQHCISHNMKSALCQFIVYDSNLGLSADTVDSACDQGAWATNDQDELRLLAEHMKCKENLYKQEGNWNPAPSYTMSSWQNSLIAAGNLDLTPPLFVKVYQDFLINF